MSWSFFSRRHFSVCGFSISCFLIMLGFVNTVSNIACAAEPDYVPLIKTESLAPYVHRISLYDEFGVAITLADEPARPYSVSRSCSKCHEYGVIASGWHFNAHDPKVDPGRPGEPWILSDWRTGTQLPLSYRAWPKTYRPQQLGMSTWDFTKVFGRHLPGGIADDGTTASTSTASEHESANEEEEDDDDFSLTPINPDAAKSEKKASATTIDPHQPRWKQSGNLEIDCMTCHADEPGHDRIDWAIQLEQTNYRWVHSSLMGLGLIKGSAAELPENYNPKNPSSTTDGPTVTWNRSKFTLDGRAIFNIKRSADPELCQECHTIRPIDDKDSWQRDQDVHLAAGLSCVDCHSNGIDHQMIRGAELGPNDNARPEDISASCRGCHIGVKGNEQLRGRFGAPYPKHNGFPDIHFQNLSCTTCHSGPKPTGTPRFIQTSMAHGLGLAEHDRRRDIPPYIIEPVFMRVDEKIMPHRLIWPAFWAIADSTTDSLQPIAPEIVSKVAAIALPERKPLDWHPLTSDQITSTLQLLAKIDLSLPPQAMLIAPINKLVLTTTTTTSRYPVYIANGKCYQLSKDNQLISENSSLAEPYVWPLAHNVRPAQQALGNSCTDCHRLRSPFFFGETIAAAPARLDPDSTSSLGPKVDMHQFLGRSRLVDKIWGMLFPWRPVMKLAGFAFTTVLVAFIFLYAVRGFSWIARKAGHNSPKG